jgi:hypothetical protein
MNLNALLQHEPSLWALAIEHYGYGLPNALTAIFARCPPQDPDRHYVWRFVEPASMIEQLQRVCAPGSAEPIVRREQRHAREDLIGAPVRELKLVLLDEHRIFLFHELLQALPIDRLPTTLMELRLQLDIGL